jgi:L-asparagine oxygenase
MARISGPLDVSCVFTLTDEESLQMGDLIQSLRHPANIRALGRDEERLLEIELASKHIPLRLMDKLIRFRDRGNLDSVLLIKNLPLDPELPDTPADGRPVEGKTTNYSEYNLFLTLMNLGQPIAYEDEKEGMIVQNICPVRGQEIKQENTSSRSFLKLHTEDGFHPFKPDYLSLICVRPDRTAKAQTLVTSVGRAIARLSPEVIDLLRKELYRIRFSSSFTPDGAAVRYSDWMPVLEGNPEMPEMTMDNNAMESSDPMGELALASFSEALQECVSGVVMEPGEMVVLDNRMAAHGRTSFTPAYDGKDRWLQRMFIVRDLSRSRILRPHGGNVCQPVLFDEPSLNTAVA